MHVWTHTETKFVSRPNFRCYPKCMSSRLPTPQIDSDSESSAVIDRPKMFAVVLLNDDYTPMDFVVNVLKRFFNKVDVEAHKVMLDVHQQGSGIAGIYTREIAEMKVMQTNQYSTLHQHPLKTIYKEADL